MASMMLTDGSSSYTALRLIDSNRRNGVFLPRRCVGQLCLRTTASGRGRIVSIRSSADAAMVIDEYDVGKNIISEIKTEVSRMRKAIGAFPVLAVIVIGDKTLPSDAYYKVVSGFIGIQTLVIRVAEDSSEEKVLKYVTRFNDDPCVHGILVELSLLSHMDKHKLHNILSAISVEKDVGGFHPLNIGRLAMRGREPLFVPRTPKGCIELLHRYNFEIKGKRAVVIGKSTNNFDMPVALLLQREDATVTIIHSSTKKPEEITRQADILISAVDKPNTVRGSWIKPGAVVINVGLNLAADPNHSRAGQFLGCICHEEVSKVASAIIAVTGDTGFMPLVLLLSNTLTAAKRYHNFM